MNYNPLSRKNIFFIKQLRHIIFSIFCLCLYSFCLLSQDGPDALKVHTKAVESGETIDGHLRFYETSNTSSTWEGNTTDGSFIFNGYNEPTSINDINEPGPKGPYPNPVVGEINIPASDATQVVLSNIKGQPIGSMPVEPNSYSRFSFTDLPDGMYFISIISKKSVSTQKIINIDKGLTINIDNAPGEIPKANQPMHKSTQEEKNYTLEFSDSFNNRLPADSSFFLSQLQTSANGDTALVTLYSGLTTKFNDVYGHINQDAWALIYGALGQQLDSIPTINGRIPITSLAHSYDLFDGTDISVIINAPYAIPDTFCRHIEPDEDIEINHKIDRDMHVNTTATSGDYIQFNPLEIELPWSLFMDEDGFEEMIVTVPYDTLTVEVYSSMRPDTTLHIFTPGHNFVNVLPEGYTVSFTSDNAHPAGAVFTGYYGDQSITDVVNTSNQFSAGSITVDELGFTMDSIIVAAAGFETLKDYSYVVNQEVNIYDFDLAPDLDSVYIWAYGKNSTPTGAGVSVWKDGIDVMTGTVDGDSDYTSTSISVPLPFTADSLVATATGHEKYLTTTGLTWTTAGGLQKEFNLTSITYPHSVTFNLNSDEAGEGHIVRDSPIAITYSGGSTSVPTSSQTATFSWTDTNPTSSLTYNIDITGTGHDDIGETTISVGTSRTENITCSANDFYASVPYHVTDQNTDDVEDATITANEESGVTGSDGKVTITGIDIDENMYSEPLETIVTYATTGAGIVSGGSGSHPANAGTNPEQDISVTVSDAQEYTFTGRVISINGSDFISGSNVLRFETSEGVYHANSTGGNFSVTVMADPDEDVEISGNASGYEAYFISVVGRDSRTGSGPAQVDPDDLDDGSIDYILGKTSIVTNGTWIATLGATGFYRGASVQRYIWNHDVADGGTADQAFLDAYDSMFRSVPGACTTPIYGQMVNISGGIVEDTSPPGSPNGTWLIYQWTGGGNRNTPNPGMDGTIAWTETVNNSIVFHEMMEWLTGDGGEGYFFSGASMTEAGKAKIVYTSKFG